MSRRVRWFSSGIASAIAAKLDIADHGHDGNVIAYCETGSEDEDNERFLRDCEPWFGQQVIRLRNPQFPDTWSVWEKRRYMSGIAGAPCTSELKISPRLAFQQPGDVHVFGYTADHGDVKRFEHFKRNYNANSRRTWIGLRVFAVQARPNGSRPYRLSRCNGERGVITFACPKCDTDYDIGDYLDHIGDMRGNRFEFECKGCCTFECEVDWDPMIYPIASSVVPTQTRESDHDQ